MLMTRSTFRFGRLSCFSQRQRPGCGAETVETDGLHNVALTAAIRSRVSHQTLLVPNAPAHSASPVLPRKLPHEARQRLALERAPSVSEWASHVPGTATGHPFGRIIGSGSPCSWSTYSIARSRDLGVLRYRVLP